MRAQNQARVREAAVSISLEELLAIGRGNLLDFGSRRSKGTQGGPLQSPLRGRGMEFEESRPYSPGDDARHMDWRVTARTGHAYSKLFREERERPVYLWLDLRASMWFATHGSFKSVQAARIAALLAWSAVRRGDRIGGMIFSGGGIHEEFRPVNGSGSAVRLLRHIANVSAGGSDHGDGADAARKALSRLEHVNRPGQLLFFISDFRNLGSDCDASFSRLARHNDLVFVYLYDLLEAELPPPGAYRVGYGGDVIDLRVDADLATGYAEQHRQRLQALRQRAMSCRGRIITVCSSDDALETVRAGWLGGRGK